MAGAALDLAHDVSGPPPCFGVAGFVVCGGVGWWSLRFRRTGVGRDPATRRARPWGPATPGGGEAVIWRPENRGGGAGPAAPGAGGGGGEAAVRGSAAWVRGSAA
ncbi:hypothetical protein Sya03_01370 [Spirilliplanes yamanashiensis]|uniref:Uncharacterized protein n=1 Tax=Spirilliplanes yamanashiensis TaxID=42233 RepID=A0A8J3Y386_9ACTN|nr:hypothetical protein Sya03_01370 [Spirilliplanes yamanashiensis]